MLLLNNFKETLILKMIFLKELNKKKHSLAIKLQRNSTKYNLMKEFDVRQISKYVLVFLSYVKNAFFCFQRQDLFPLMFNNCISLKPHEMIEKNVMNISL